MRLRLFTYALLCLVLSSLSLVNLVHTAAQTLPSCVSICDETGDAYGAGFIVVKGYVVTAKHVTDSFAQHKWAVYVYLADGTLAQVTKIVPLAVIKNYPLDATLLKVDTEALPPARLGDSDAISAGEQVFAIGAPYGLKQSITVGIISALHRDFAFDGIAYIDSIQTSGLLSPGNSGGPLLSQQGQVLGVNVIGVGSNIGMTIPISQVRTALQRNGLRL